MNRFLLFSILFLLSTWIQLFSADYNFTVLQTDANSFKFKIEFEQPEFVEESGKVYASYQNAKYAVGAENAYLPVVTRLINFSESGEAEINIVSRSNKVLEVQNYLIVENVSSESSSINSIIEVKYLGRYNKIPLYALNIFPVKYRSDSKSIEWLEYAEIEVVLKSSDKNAAGLISQKSRSGAILKELLPSYSTVYNQEESISTSVKTNSVNSMLANSAAYSNVFKLSVDSEGIYKVTYDDLMNAEYPVDVVDPLKLRLVNKGREIPIYFSGAADGSFDENDYFEFWGEPNEKTLFDEFPEIYKDPFSDINVYWLVTSSSPGLRMSEESGLNGSGFVFSPTSFRDVIHFEEDNQFETFGHSSSGLNRPSHEVDHWFYDKGISAPEGKAYEFDVPHPDESGLKGVVVTAAFRGKSTYSSSSNLLYGHELQLKIQGKDNTSKQIAEVQVNDYWRNQEMRLISNADSSKKIPQSILINGTNYLEVDMFQTGVSDIVLLNWFNVEYSRKYRANENYLKFRVDSDYFDNPYVNLGDTLQIEIDGFATRDISVYKLGVSKIVNGKVGKATETEYGQYAISIFEQVYDPKTEYVACTEAAKKSPLAIEAYTSWQSSQPGEVLSAINRQIDYLIITHDIFYQNALALRDLKVSQGLTAEVVTVENIYDTFNYGIKSPITIKNFIKRAVDTWSASNPLQYVVFVGKASYDYKGYISSDADLVPTFLFQTEKYGAAASDYWYALLDEDDYIPDVSVARIPASTNEELLNYIDKIENYGTGSTALEEWTNQTLFISGNDASGSDAEYLTNAPIFRSQNLRLLNAQLPSKNFTTRLNTVKNEEISGTDPHFGSTTDLIQYFDNGLSFVNFLGHGGGGIWADVELMNLTDVQRLNNGYKLPFIASMTCYTGAFENPNILGLAEEFILAEQKGAIAFLGASGVGWKYNDFAIEWGLFEYLWKKDLTFGQAVDLMKIYYLANPVYSTNDGDFYTFGYNGLKESMVSQYNLFGDPALKLAIPQNSLKVVLSDYSPASLDTVNVTLSNAGFTAGSAHAVVTDQESNIIFDNYYSYSDGFSFAVEIPDSSAGEQYTVKVFVQGSSESASGYAKFVVERPFVKNIAISPAKPDVYESIDFTLSTKSYLPVTKMELTNFRNYNISYGSSTRIQMEQVNDTLFQSLSSFSGFSSGGLKYVDVEITDDSGETTVYRRLPFTVYDSRPDIKIKDDSFGYAGTEKLQIQFVVENTSDSSLSNIDLKCYDEKGISEGLPFTSAKLNLLAGESRTITKDYFNTSTNTSQVFKVEIDPDNLISESDEDNNSLFYEAINDHFYISKSLGTSTDGLINDTLLVFNKWKYYAAPNDLAADAVIKFSKVDLTDFYTSAKQADLKYVPVLNNSDTSGIKISFPEQLQATNSKLKLIIPVDTSQIELSDIYNLALCKYDNYLGLWVKVEGSSYNDGLFTTELATDGSYAIFNIQDEQEPSIEITANGRPLSSDILLTSEPQLSFLIEDANGVNYTNSLNIYINDDPLVIDGVAQIQQQISIPDSLKSAKAIAISANLNLNPGEQEVTVSVADVNGNIKTLETGFTVAGDVFMELHGNYPNPFVESTNISYTLSTDINSISTKIYTLSGRLIRKKMLPFDDSIGESGDDATQVGYHELYWDGSDDDGKQVANGVYFLVIKAKFDEQTITKTMKIARLR